MGMDFSMEAGYGFLLDVDEDSGLVFDLPNKCPVLPPRISDWAYSDTFRERYPFLTVVVGHFYDSYRSAAIFVKSTVVNSWDTNSLMIKDMTISGIEREMISQAAEDIRPTATISTFVIGSYF